MLKPLLRNNKSVLLLWIYNLYKKSHIPNLLGCLYNRMTLYFKYTFLWKITEIKEKDILLILENSKFVSWLLGVYSPWKHKMTSYFRKSAVANLKDAIAKELYLLPVRTTSIILVTIIITNTFFSIVLLSREKEITLLAWIIRVLFLIIGLAGLFCNVNFEDIKRTSFVVKYMNKRGKK